MENIRRQPVLIMAVNFAFAMLLYMAERWFFFWMNHLTFQDVTFSDMMTICGGGIRFDVSALCYLNILCIAMQSIPAKFRDTVGYQRAVKIIYLIINTIFQHRCYMQASNHLYLFIPLLDQFIRIITLEW